MSDNLQDFKEVTLHQNMAREELYFVERLIWIEHKKSKALVRTNTLRVCTKTLVEMRAVVYMNCDPKAIETMWPWTDAGWVSTAWGSIRISEVPEYIVAYAIHEKNSDNLSVRLSDLVGYFWVEPTNNYWDILNDLEGK